MTISLNRRVVGEQILSAAIRSDEAEAFSIVEPLNNTCDHDRDPEENVVTGHMPDRGSIKGGKKTGEDAPPQRTRATDHFA